MTTTTMDSSVTSLLQNWNRGEPGALSRLMTVIYDDLRCLAASRIRREPPEHTLQATDLVHETFLKFVERRQVHWLNRDQFFGFTARLMHWVLVEHARRVKALKRGGGQKSIPLEEEAPNLVELVDEEIRRLEDALEDLKSVNPDGYRVVMLRFIYGLKYEQIADSIGVCPGTVRNRWRVAKSWLYRRLKQD